MHNVFWKLISIKKLISLIIYYPHLVEIMTILSSNKDKAKIGNDIQDVKYKFEYTEFPELVLFLACIGSNIAGSAAYYYMYHYFSKKSNFPFEFKNSKHTCSRHLNASFSHIHNKVNVTLFLWVYVVLNIRISLYSLFVTENKKTKFRPLWVSEWVENY